MIRLSPCAACGRHVKHEDCRCPFCGECVRRDGASPRSVDRRNPRSPLMAAGVVGAAIAGTACGGTVQQHASVDAGNDSASAADASEASTSPFDASADVGVDTGIDTGSQDATEDFGGGIALYGAPPPPPGPFDDSGQDG
jgi:hypothetical protein